MLRATESTRHKRMAEVTRGSDTPAYTTSPGWLGYPRRQAGPASARRRSTTGFMHIKLKVGARLADDVRRCAIARAVLGPERSLMVDANQVWEVPEAIEWVAALASFAPALGRGADQPG